MLSKTKVKYIQSLGHKKVRDELLQFTAEGPKVVEGLLQTGKYNCLLLFGLKDWIDQHGPFYKASGTEVMEIEPFELEKISLLTTPNVVLGVFVQKESKRFDPVNKVTLILDGIRDPGNLGTIIRTAEWFGVQNIICSEDCVDCYNPKVVQATMGSLGSLNVSYLKVAEILAMYPAIRVYAATLKGVDVNTLGQVREGFVIIGNEANGIRPGLMELVKYEITIPRIGSAESLNAAVACGIILQSITRDRNLKVNLMK